MSKVKYLLGKAFTSNSTSSDWLTVLRLGTALALMCKVLSELPYLNALYGSNGFIPPDIAVFSQNAYIPTILGIYHHFSGFCSEAVYVKVFFIAALLLAVSLLMGYMTRFAAVICWALMVIIFNSSHLTSYGFDAVLLTLLFYCMIFPVGRSYSLDLSQNDPTACLPYILREWYQQIAWLGMA
jgi:uncharacterized membrane protein YphA (DoxX/SURF4 family)